MNCEFLLQSGRGRDRFRREHPPRPEEKGHHGRSNPPSRHLWVGNISHSIDESTLARQFLRFGELESVAFQPGRSYAFVNFRNEDDAFAAIRELQGFSVAGNPLRIEFAKAVSFVNLCLISCCCIQLTFRPLVHNDRLEWFLNLVICDTVLPIKFIPVIGEKESARIALHISIS